MAKCIFSLNGTLLFRLWFKKSLAIAVAMLWCTQAPTWLGIGHTRAALRLQSQRLCEVDSMNIISGPTKSKPLLDYVRTAPHDKTCPFWWVSSCKPQGKRGTLPVGLQIACGFDSFEYASGSFHSEYGLAWLGVRFRCPLGRKRRCVSENHTQNNTQTAPLKN